MSHSKVCTLIVHCVKVWHWMMKRLFFTPHFNLNAWSVAFVDLLLVYLHSEVSAFTILILIAFLLHMFLHGQLLLLQIPHANLKGTRIYKQTLCSHKSIMRKAFGLTFRGVNWILGMWWCYNWFHSSLWLLMTFLSCQKYCKQLALGWINHYTVIDKA